MQKAKKKVSEGKPGGSQVGTLDCSSGIQNKLLERYTRLIEEKHKAVDFGIELTEERDSLRAEIKRLSDFLEQERSAARSNAESIVNLENELGKTRSLHSKLQEKHEEMSCYLMELESQVQGWKTEFAKVLKRLKEEEKENKDSKKSQKSLVKRIRQMEKITQRDQQEHAKLVEYIATLEETAVQHDKALEDWVSRANTLKTQNANLDVEVTGLKKLVQDLESATQDWEREHGKLVLEIKRMESELEKWGSEHSKLVSYAKDIEARRSHEIDVIQDLEQALSRSESQKTFLSEEHHKLCELLSETQGIRDHLKLEHEKLVAYITTLEAERDLLKTERQEFMDAKMRVEGELRFIQSHRLYRILRWLKKRLPQRV